MSKAFTREADDAGGDEIAPVRPQLLVGERNYITREGADRLRQLLNDLLQEKRALARDNSEPSVEIKAALRRTESAIQKLQSTLDSVIIAERPVDLERVAFGASVRLRDENGQEETYQIVGVDESDPAQGRISWISPLARALLNQRAGDKIRFQSPAGSQELTILKVEYRPR